MKIKGIVLRGPVDNDDPVLPKEDYDLSVAFQMFGNVRANRDVQFNYLATELRIVRGHGTETGISYGKTYTVT